MRKQTANLVLVALAILGAATASGGDFLAYEGKDAIQEGQGGAKKEVKGIDFWSEGAPPRKFQLLGYISDSRLKTGLVGKMRMSRLESSIAKEAKKVGGDAVILIGAEVETSGYVGQSQTTGSATATSYGNNTRAWGQNYGSTQSAAVKRQHTRYAVVKYISE